MPTDSETVNFAPEAPGGMRFIGNTELRARERAAMQERQHQQQPQIVNLARFVGDAYRENRQAREKAGVDAEMLAALHQRNSEYSQEQLLKLAQQGGTKVFLGLTGVKCRHAEAWIHDVADHETKPWSLSPTPIAELPGEITQAIVSSTIVKYRRILQEEGMPMTPQQAYEYAADMREQAETRIQEEAETRANGMERKIHDQFTEGGWANAFDELVTDLVTLKAGIIKGPVLEQRPKRNWVKSRYTGRTRQAIQTERVHRFYRVSPFDVSPADGATTPQDAYNICERTKYIPKNLRAMKGVPHWNSQAIDLVIHEHRHGGFRIFTPTDVARAQLEIQGDRLMQNRHMIEAIEFWGSVPGEVLIMQGMNTDPEGKKVVASADYEVSAVVAGSYVLYADFNRDPLATRPYSKTVWAKIPGAFWGKGVPECMKDLQRIVNAAGRSLVNNATISSGPQISINDIQRIAHGQSLTGIRPYKIWQFYNRTVNQLKAIEFWQAQSTMADLIRVLEFFMRLADDFTGIPAYAYGSDRIAGAGRTASGLSMLMNNASRGIKAVIGRIDKDIFQTVIRRQFDWNMEYDEDESIKGDVEIVPHGAMAAVIKEQMAAQRMEMLNATANPIDQQIMGYEGRANLLREAAGPLQIGRDEIVPDKQEMRKRAEQLEAMQQQAMAQEQAAGQAA